MLQFALLISVFLVKSTQSSEINFDDIPSCAARSDCFPYHSSRIGCTQLTKNCFCNALAPLNCASQNCTGNDWYGLEDWYSTQCPGDPPLVSMDPEIPLGARKCIRDWIVPQRCNASITRNCFCRLQNEHITEAMAECISTGTGTEEQQATDLAQDFYRDTCIYKEDVTGEIRPDDTQEEVIPSPEQPPKEEKGDLMWKIVGGVASFITILGLLRWFFFGCFCGKSGRQLLRAKMHPKLFGESDDRPPSYTKV